MDVEKWFLILQERTGHDSIVRTIDPADTQKYFHESAFLIWVGKLRGNVVNNPNVSSSLNLTVTLLRRNVGGYWTYLLPRFEIFFFKIPCAMPLFSSPLILQFSLVHRMKCP